jgi:hypothetical protein
MTALFNCTGSSNSSARVTSWGPAASSNWSCHTVCSTGDLPTATITATNTIQQVLLSSLLLLLCQIRVYAVAVSHCALSIVMLSRSRWQCFIAIASHASSILNIYWFHVRMLSGAGTSSEAAAGLYRS